MKLRTLALAIFTLGVLFPWSNSAFAGEKVSIEGQERINIQQAMKRFIDEGTVDGVYRHYDPVTGELLRLQFTKLHGIRKKGDFYVSCADFEDPRGRLVDLDIMVIQAGDDLRATQAIVHQLPGEKKKRPYHLED